jgi:two-component sensor histidine kinase
VQYETESKERDISFLQSAAELQKSKLTQARLAKNLTFAGLGLMVMVAGLFFSRARIKQRSNRQLELQKIEINQTNQSLQNLLEEKGWLLREIHHRVKNNLQIVMSLLNTQLNFLEDDKSVFAIRDSQRRIYAIPTRPSPRTSSSPT